MRIVFLFLSLSLLTFFASRAQAPDALVRKGNRYYKSSDFDESEKTYEKALKTAPGNTNARYNLGNAEFRGNDYEKAAANFDEVIAGKADSATRASAYYNKGVAMMKQKKLDESIDAWKNALRINPEDSDARDNLIKALLEKKKQQQEQQQQQQKQQEKKNPDKKDEKKPQDQKKEEEDHPKPQPSKLTKQQVEQYLRSLIQREKDVQEKMNQSKTREPNSPDKDW